MQVLSRHLFTLQTRCEYPLNTMRAPPGMLRMPKNTLRVLAKTAENILQTRYRWPSSPSSTLQVPSRPAAGTVQTRCGYPSNSMWTPATFVAGTLQTRSGYLPKMLLVTSELAASIKSVVGTSELRCRYYTDTLQVLSKPLWIIQNKLRVPFRHTVGSAAGTSKNAARSSKSLSGY